eukprot:TRINITY_DN1140_c0_g1_i3.p3 TRINITY_DN1140_c0_g1~~TRINITY_DN1140_c0_g1_i3.p3  ORF type:complete len:128 (+),score=19.19 TRINITY_DN1140_c0_g1_i3:379-762(+)
MGISHIIYGRYRLWRMVVTASNESFPFLLGFSALTIGFSYFIGTIVMNSLGPDKKAQQKRLERFREDHPQEYKEAMQMADMNKRMLAEMVNDVKRGKDQAWWDFAMKGRVIPHSASTEDLARGLRDR